MQKPDCPRHHDEVFKYLRRKLGHDAAARAATCMQRGQLVDIDSALILDAAAKGLPMADSLIYATTQLHRAELWTQDADFEGLPGVNYFAVKNKCLSTVGAGQA